MVFLDKGRGPGRGWWRSDLCWRLVDFFSRVWEDFFLVFFFEAFFHVVFQRFFLDFGGVSEPQMGLQINLGVFFAIFFL